MKTNMMELSKFIKWSVFGDGCVSMPANSRNAHFSITRSPEHADYIEYIRGKLDKGLFTIRVSEYLRKDNDKRVISLITSSHPIFTRIRDRQYIKGHRVLDSHMTSLIGWEELAVLYQDDGSLCYNNVGSQIVRISTCAYSYYEHEKLRNLFAEKFDLIFNINRTSKDLYQLNLAAKSQERFFDGIKKYVVPSYKYKLPVFLQKEAPAMGDDLVYVAEHR